jgi:hypothetical protein
MDEVIVVHTVTEISICVCDQQLDNLVIYL